MGLTEWLVVVRRAQESTRFKCRWSLNSVVMKSVPPRGSGWVPVGFFNNTNSEDG